MSDTTGLRVRWNGRDVALKWHRGKRRAADVIFTGARVREALRLGASVEVDINRHGGGGFAVLHDATLDRETTGTGPVAEARPDDLRPLSLRANDGTPSQHPVMVLEDLRAAIEQTPVHPNALLQLDLKTPADALTEADCAGFATAIAGLEANVILSSGDAGAVRRLADSCPGVRIGHDPCYDEARLAAFAATADVEAFVESALAEAAEAGGNVEMIYLAIPLIIEGAARGANLSAAFRERGYRVDAWTVKDAGPASAATVRALLDLGVDQITTDDPEGLERAVARF